MANADTNTKPTTESWRTRFARALVHDSAICGETARVAPQCVDQDYLAACATEHTTRKNSLGRLELNYRGVLNGRLWHVRVSH